MLHCGEGLRLGMGSRGADGEPGQDGCLDRCALVSACLCAYGLVLFLFLFLLHVHVCGVYVCAIRRAHSPPRCCLVCAALCAMLSAGESRVISACVTRLITTLPVSGFGIRDSDFKFWVVGLGVRIGFSAAILGLMMVDTCSWCSGFVMPRTREPHDTTPYAPPELPVDATA
eukprot:3802067-Rhodomonas_salina.3